MKKFYRIFNVHNYTKFNSIDELCEFNFLKMSRILNKNELNKICNVKSLSVFTYYTYYNDIK